MREVFEESGIHVKNIEYQYSQPWPFPSSLMLGFTAEAYSKKIICNKKELEDAKWFSKTELKDLVNLQVISSGNIIVPNFCNTAAAGSEEFEGCFVEVSNAICNNDNAGFGEWIINDGSGDVSVDDLI